uniref:DUF6933 domain-containing protein n=1 Tax=Virgibacillus oceani TaxID=1479511 RepID=A0A917M271_9BACI|nr:hypothetical protein [Virgibacillus oceani]GGG74485.1 hypothetical protein GCM10011398_18970 [Virgibacillus oceani]
MKKGIQDNFLADGFDKNVIETYLEECESVEYAPISDRRVISQINEMIRVTKHVVEYEGLSGIEEHISKLNRFNNDFVMLSLPDTYPIKAMRIALK